MHTFASIAIGVLMFATIAVLFAGLIGMVRGQSAATSNKLMRYRVLLQGATLLLLIIFIESAAVVSARSAASRVRS